MVIRQTGHWVLAAVIVGLLTVSGCKAPDWFKLKPGQSAYQGSSSNETKGKAEKGDAEAQRKLGLAYYTGLGVAPDAAEAYKWFSLAASQGKEDAAYFLKKVSDEMTPEQIAEGKKRAAAFVPKKKSE